MSGRLEEKFTHYTAKNRTGQLERGFLGTVADSPGHLSVYVDPKRIDRDALKTDLTRSAAAAKAKDRAGATDLAVEIRASCFSADQVLEAQNVIEARDFSPRAKQVPMQWHLDPRDSRFHVDLREEDKDVAADLVRVLGDRVVIGHDVPVLTAGAYGVNRRYDVSPHYGGASIHADGDGESKACTSAFKVKYTANNSAGLAGNYGMMTAGHCFDNGTRVESGSKLVGYAYEDAIPALSSDGLFLDDHHPTDDTLYPHQTYEDDVYANARDGDVTTTTGTASAPAALMPIFSRDVAGEYHVGSASSETSTELCVSGRVSGNTCNAKVLATFDHLSFCFTDTQFTDEGCIFDYFKMAHPNSSVQMSVPGDSGAPVYVCVDRDISGTSLDEAESDTTPNATGDKWCKDEDRAGPADSQNYPSDATKHPVKIVGLVSLGYVEDSIVGVSRVDNLEQYMPFTVAHNG